MRRPWVPRISSSSCSAGRKERQHKLARMTVDKARYAPDGFGVVLSQNLAHGQFCLNSAPLRRDRYPQMVDELPDFTPTSRRR